MVDSIGSASFRPPPPPSGVGSQSSLTDDQTALIEETLSGYDADNLTESDAASIVEAFADAGIAPSSAFADKLAEVGFDAQEIGGLAGADRAGAGQPPPPPSSSGSLDLTDAVDYLETLFEEKEYSATDNSTIAAQLAERFGLSEGESLINITV
ncbi:hypothetical protein [Paraglaciecola arctica]|uniref:Uncharacterized protein n=1 Tax=Paraglaciecola arctica BSs20135 TaxID=493475 RepID=K6Z4L7_9ALTE|nr:hypothetical protein [Paraglaciecola arctica]GAC18355.1 hypothetical protein GARC_1380 [Paraglaciecola arctica BSs20135]